MELHELDAVGASREVRGELARDVRLAGPRRAVEDHLAFVSQELGDLRERLARDQEIIRQTRQRVVGDSFWRPVRFGVRLNQAAEVMDQITVADLKNREPGAE